MLFGCTELRISRITLGKPDASVVKDEEFTLRVNPLLYRLGLHKEGSSEDLLANIPIHRLSFDFEANEFPSLVLEVQAGWWVELKLTPEQVTFIRRANIVDVPSWVTLSPPVIMREIMEDIGPGYEVMFDDGSRHLIGSDDIETDMWDSVVIQYRKLVDWDRAWETSKKQITKDDLCAGCGHKREHHRPRLICGRLVNESGIPEYCQCMRFQDAV
jgi:hypothetical protein